MNRLKYIILFIPLLFAGAACKKQQLLTYSIKDNIYFNYAPLAARMDTANVSFAYSPLSVQDTTILIPIQVTGVPKGQDRTFIITVDPSSTETATGHYTLPAQFIMPAGKLIDSLPVKLHRAADLQDTVKTLILNLEPNQNFNTDIKALGTIGVLSFKINASDILLAGPYWNSIFATYFGTFSVKKLQLMNQIVGMPLNFPITGIYDLNLSADASLYAIAMSRYLKDQAAAGNTIYEDDGVTPMTMGAGYQ